MIACAPKRVGLIQAAPMGTEQEQTNEEGSGLNENQLQLLLELIRSTKEFAIVVLKTSILINGAAAIALLTFLGNFVSDGPGCNTPILYATALLCFTIGTFVAALSPISGFLLNVEAVSTVNEDTSGKFGKLAVKTIALVVAAFLLFGLGVLFSFLAIF